MKLIYLMSFLFIVSSCGKDDKPLSAEQQKLITMRNNIIKDWRIAKIMIVAPSNRYGILISSCDESAVFRYGRDSQFALIGDIACNAPNAIGKWYIPKPDSLYIKWSGFISYGSYEKLKVVKLTADTMKWHVISSVGINNPNDTVEYTLIPN